mmetsp:Transcript_4031/g.7751  ORF Transcript_4031/g.7751 Transcript_4031/m.7751 type:complete len:115 (+) Transcript_4031:1004-1348(+)
MVCPRRDYSRVKGAKVFESLSHLFSYKGQTFLSFCVFPVFMSLKTPSPSSVLELFIKSINHHYERRALVLDNTVREGITKISLSPMPVLPDTIHYHIDIANRCDDENGKSSLDD